MGWIIVCGIIACITVCVVILVLILQMQQRKMYEMQQAEIQLNNPYKEIVHNTSDRYKYLLEIRDSYKFTFTQNDMVYVGMVYKHKVYVDIDTFTKFKTFNIDKYIEDYVRKNKEYIAHESCEVLENRTNLIKYKKDIANAPQFKSPQFCLEHNLEYGRYNKVEAQECYLVTYRNVKVQTN